MKRIIALCLVFVLTLGLTACGSDDMYYSYDMTKYVTLGEYSKVVDTSSDAYKYYVSDFCSSALSQKVEKGQVKDGDVANIDFTGYLNGKEFEGGSSKDYNLTIGAGQFIDGFEEGLVGVEIGSTVDLNLTFPKNYGKEELNGKAVVFTVKVNYVTRVAQANEETVKSAGYDSVEAFEKEMKEHAICLTMFNNVLSTATVSEYPQKELDVLLNLEVKYYEDYCKANGLTLEDFVASNDLTVDEFKDYLSQNKIKSTMKYVMVSYAVLQKNDIKLTNEDIEKTKAELVLENGEDFVNKLDDIDIQHEAVVEKAYTVFLNEATVK